MKLQKLQIHNIASIEDATIDFETAPLSTSEVFLITGKTGAGKSTILDAICLALYATTPRLANTNMQGESTDGDKEVKIDDPRQLMRRNTGEAYVTLTFTGSNGVHYEARWSVARARNKATGNLQGKKWQLHNLDKDHILAKDKEIADEIRQAVGLEFGQFCRTTLLAQGEFTRFLNSKDKEKAEILEKITGVDIYSKIGKKVFEVTAAKQQEWEEANRAVAGIKVLTDDEIADIQRQISKFSEEEDKLKVEREATDRKLKWLEDEAEIAKKTAEAITNYNEAEEKTRGEEFRARELTLRQWNETIVARQWIKALALAKETKETYRVILENSKPKFQELLSGKKWLESDIKDTEEKLAEVEKIINSETPKAYIYERAQRIEALLQTITTGRKKIASDTNSLKEEEENLHGGLRKKKADADKEYKSAKAKFEEQESIQKKLEQNLADLKLPDLRKQKEELQETIRAIMSALEKIEALNEAKQNRQDKEDETNKLEKHISELKNKLSSLAPQIHDAKMKADDRKEVIERQRDTVEKWAKAMRSKLNVGDICPVCQQKIVSILPQEEDLDRLFAESEQLLKDANDVLEKLKDEENTLKAEIATTQKAVKKAKDDLEKDKILEKCEMTAKSACEKCGINEISTISLEALGKRLADKKFSLEELSVKIEEGEKIEKSADKSRKETDRRRILKEQLKKAADDAEKAINICEASINTTRALIKTKEEEVTDAEKEVDRILGNSSWTTDWHTDIPSFRSELKAAASAYTSNIQAREEMKQKLSEKKILLGHAAGPLDEIKAKVYGSLEGRMISDEVSLKTEFFEVENLLERVNNLSITVHSACDHLKTNSEAIGDLTYKLNDFLAKKRDMTEEHLATLNGYTFEDISAINSELTQTRENVVARKTVLDGLLLQAETHNDNRPEMAEDDTPEALKIASDLNDEKKKSIFEKRATLSAELRNDEKNKKTLSRQLADADAKKAVYEQWSRINQLLGDASGNKFRKIAQSYILNSLIHSANSYMRTLTDRYMLKVEPGSFVIMLEDAYQGYVSRAASTISGGEGFLVSLALALALSDIGNTLSVDTLFIDEGFGTLSGEPLQRAIDTLRRLHSQAGRHVGIISHVDELRERISVQIRIDQEGNNSSSQVKIVPEPET